MINIVEQNNQAASNPKSKNQVRRLSCERSLAALTENFTIK
jgi:hypothetical protein